MGPEFWKKNIVHFGLGITYDYEQILSHSVHRIYVITKLNLPTINDITIKPINFDMNCNYVRIK